MLDIRSIFFNRFPQTKRYPKWLVNSIVYLLQKLFHESEINEVLTRYGHLEGLEFIEGVLEYFDTSYIVSNQEKLNIPVSGRVIIVANHPLGALDALSLISLVREVRSDVKIVANELLMHVKPLHSLFIPVDVMGGSSTKEHIKGIYRALEEEQAVIIFPSGEVSRARPTGVRDTKWNKGFLKFAKKTQSPILPVYIKARNSSLFYGVSMINKPAAAFLLAHEMCVNKSLRIGFRVGELIAYHTIKELRIEEKQTIGLLQKHLYRIGRGKTGIFRTQKCIAHPEDRGELRKELKNAELLGSTSDGKRIYLFTYFPESSIIREIGRLRELTFRKVEEGTGGKRDIDRYDEYYKHIVLWDEDDLEIVGAYRIGEARYINEHYGHSGFYADGLFDYQQAFDPYLYDSLEMGRSFVQPRYWGSRALDYLWQGIGAYLHKHPNVRYLFGPVSLSNAYPKLAKNMIAHFYALYFPSKEPLVVARNPFVITKSELDEVQGIFSGTDYREDFKVLKEKLGAMDLSVPTLYKQYTELCEEGGIVFVDFNIDKDFADCLDSFIVLDITKIKESKRTRYIK